MKTAMKNSWKYTMPWNLYDFNVGISKQPSVVRVYIQLIGPYQINVMLHGLFTFLEWPGRPK